MSAITFDEAYDLSGQIAVVTGAAGEIGFLIASQLAERGAKVALVDISEKVTEAASKLTGKGHTGWVVDLTDASAIAPAVKSIEAHYERIDILVNNAGIALIDDAVDVPKDRWDLQVAINLTAPFLLAQAVGPGMLSRRYGRVVNISSQAGVIALQGHAGYSSTKAGLIGLTKVLALEWGPHGVTANAVSPTVVNTALGRRVFDGEEGVRFKSLLPTRRFAEPEEISLAVLYLVSQGSGSTTGANLLVDGGYSMQ